MTTDDTDERDTELVGSYSPQPCYHCGVQDDPRSQTCHECGEFICRWCDQRPGGLGLPLSHTPEDHLTPPESCECCGSLDISTRTEGFGSLCPRCTMETLGRCYDCGRRLDEGEWHSEGKCTYHEPRDREFPPGP